MPDFLIVYVAAFCVLTIGGMPSTDAILGAICIAVLMTSRRSTDDDRR